MEPAGAAVPMDLAAGVAAPGEQNVAAAQTAEPEHAPAAAPSPPGINFRVWRRRAGDPTGHFDMYEWSPRPNATVLDALLDIRRDRDRSLVVRHSCMHGSCGACGVRINGREALACDTPVADTQATTISVEPLRGQRPVADLATDMVDFHARLEPTGFTVVRASELPAAEALPEGVRAYTRFEDCTECGLCLSACPVSRFDPAYIGPAAMAAVARMVEEPRGHSAGPLFTLAAEPDSVWRCHDALECTAVCPEAVDPARSLLQLRRRIALDRVKSLFGRG
jgi:succinate dehydrogenase / fumarate reductase iron-sulfur subunit